MGPSVPNFTLIGDGGGHSSPRNSNMCQSCAVLATFSPFSKSSRIYWSRWNMVRNQRLSIYSRRPNFSYNRRTVKGTGPLKHYKFCQNVGLLAGFPLRQKKTNTDEIPRLPWVCSTGPWSLTGAHKPLNFKVWSMLRYSGGIIVFPRRENNRSR